LCQRATSVTFFLNKMWRSLALLLFVGLALSLDYESSLFHLRAAGTPAVDFAVDLSKPTTPFPHFWKQCVGSGHATLALREDYRRYLTQAHHDIGFKYVRFHAVLDDDMSTYTIVNGKAQTSFFNVDNIYDFLLDIGMKPLIELSFMPTLLSSGNTTVFHYQGNTTPPSSYSQWAELITAFVSHLVERYGIDEVRQWPMEVWNEPNCGFWTGSQAEYFTLYNYTALAIKAIDSQLIVGGPATCQSQWIPEFLNYTKTYNVPVDFVSTHEYPTDIQPVTRDVMTQVTATARAQAGSLPLYYTEYNDGLYSNPPYHDTPYAAAFIVKNVHDVQGNVDMWSWWTFSDIFEEQGFSSVPFFDPNGWGLMSRYGIPKPSYRAFQLLNQIGDKQLSCVRNDTSSSITTNLEAFATLKTTQGKQSQIDIMVYNFQVPGNAMANETAVITITNAPSTISTTATLHMLDKNHSNPAQLWLDQGEPAYPTKAQLKQYQIASELTSQTIYAKKLSSTSLQFTLTLLPQSVGFITLGY